MTSSSITRFCSLRSVASCRPESLPPIECQVHQRGYAIPVQFWLNRLSSLLSCLCGTRRCCERTLSTVSHRRLPACPALGRPQDAPIAWHLGDRRNRLWPRPFCCVVMWEKSSIPAMPVCRRPWGPRGLLVVPISGPQDSRHSRESGNLPCQGPSIFAGIRCLWIPAFAGMTLKTKRPCGGRRVITSWNTGTARTRDSR